MKKYIKEVEALFFDGTNFYDLENNTDESGITYIKMSGVLIRSCITPCYIYYDNIFSMYLWQSKTDFESQYTEVPV